MSKMLESVLEAYINGDTEKASEIFKQHIIEVSAAINQKMMNDEEVVEDVTRDMNDDVVDEISDHKDEINAEEAYGESEGSEVEDDITVDDASDDLIDDLTDVEDVIDIDDIEDELSTDSVDGGEVATDGEEAPVEMTPAELTDKVTDLDAALDAKVDVDDFAELEAQFKALQGEEEVEHDMDLDGDGAIGDEVVDATDGSEVVEESIELTDVKVDMKDTTGKNKSPVAKGTEVLELEGSPVVAKGKGHKGFDREDMKVDTVTKDTNTVKSTDAAISKIMESTNRLTKRNKK